MKDGSQEDLVINSKITCTDHNIICCIEKVTCKKVKLYMKDVSQEDLVINSKITCTNNNIIYCIEKVVCKKVKLYMKDGSQEDLVINSRITCTNNNTIYCISCTKQSGACAKVHPQYIGETGKSYKETVRKAYWHHHQQQPIRHNPPRGGTLPATWVFQLSPAVPTKREGPE